MADLGWLGLHLPEAHGGSGFGLAELVLVVEALGAAVAPGPFLPTVWASAVIARLRQRRAAGRAACPGSPTVRSAPRWGSTTRTDLVLGAGLADLFLLPAGDDLVVATRDEVTVTDAGQHRRHAPRRRGDPRRRTGAPTACSPARARTAVVLGRLLAAAEATGRRGRRA